MILNKLSKKKYIELAYKTSYLAIIAILLLDFFFYHGFVKNNLISPIFIVVIIAAIHLATRIITKQKLNNQFATVNLYFIAPISLVLTSTAYYLEEYGLLFPNYFFNNFKFHYISLMYLAIPAVIFGVIHSNKTFWIHHWKRIFFLLMTTLALGGAILYYIDVKAYTKLMAEDGIVEYLSALFFLVAGATLLLLSRKSKFLKKKAVKNIFIAGCIIAGLALILVAGEEISWGQRIFNIETPDAIAAQNRQGEINLHNSELIWPYVYSAYAFIGTCGMLLWIIWWLLSDLFSFNKEQKCLLT